MGRVGIWERRGAERSGGREGEGGQRGKLLTAEDVCKALLWFSEGSSLVMLFEGRTIGPCRAQCYFVA